MTMIHHSPRALKKPKPSISFCPSKIEKLEALSGGDLINDSDSRASSRTSRLSRSRSKSAPKPAQSSPAAINTHLEPASSVPATQTQQILFLTFNLFSTIAVTFINKACFARVSFGFPAMLANIHFATTWLCVELLRHFKVFTPMPKTPSLKDMNFLTIVVVVGLVTPLNNSSLKMNGVGFYQVFKLLVTPVVVLLEYVLDGKILSVARSLFLILVCTAVFVSSRAALDFSLAGLGCAALWVPLAAAYKVQWGRCMKHFNVSTTLALMHVVLPYAIVVKCIISPLVDPPGIWEYHWTPEAVFWVGLSGLSAFLVNYSGFLVMGRVGALSHVLLGQLKTAVIMMGAWIIFQEHYSMVQLLGATGSVGAIVGYTKVTVLEKEAMAKKKEELLLGHDSDIVDDNDDNDEEIGRKEECQPLAGTVKNEECQQPTVISKDENAAVMQVTATMAGEQAVIVKC